MSDSGKGGAIALVVIVTVLSGWFTMAMSRHCSCPAGLPVGFSILLIAATFWLSARDRLSGAVVVVLLLLGIFGNLGIAAGC